MSRKDVLNEIYELIKEEYGDCVSVTIHVNCEGIKCEADEKPFTLGDTSMRTINGKWLERRTLPVSKEEEKEFDPNCMF